MRKLMLLIPLLVVSCTYSQVSFILYSNACSATTQMLTANTGTDVALSYTWASTPTSPIFSTPNSSTTALNFPSIGTFTISLSVTLLSGVSSYSSTINITQSPTITISQSSATTCIASNYPKYSHPVILNASGATANTYTIYPYFFNISGGNGNMQYVRPPTSTCYTISGAIGSCTGSAGSCVIVKPQFTVAVSPSPAIFCAFDSLQLLVVSVGSLAVLPIANYIWYDPNPPSILSPNNYVNGATIYPMGNCTYSVEAYDATACVSLPTLVNVSVTTCTDIKHNTFIKNSIFVYPNPANDVLTVECVTQSEVEANYTFQIINTLGQIVQTTSIQQQKTSLDIKELLSGVYFVKITSKNNVVNISKLIKE